MSTMLVVLLVVGCFAIQGFLLVRRRRAARVAATMAGAATDRPGELFFHPGHCWVRPGPDGLVTIGATDFAANFAGRVSSVGLPRAGRKLVAGQPAWTLFGSGERCLRQPMPVTGRVVAVNEALLSDPGLAQRAPYAEGWVLRARPTGLQDALGNLLRGATADLWIDAHRARVLARRSPALGALANDGGEWVPGFGELLDTQDWESLRRELFPCHEL